MSEPEIISLNILDKCYQIKCHPEKVAELRESAAYLEAKMRAYQSKQSPKEDKLTIITALNLAHELLLQKKQIESMTQYLNELQNKVVAALASTE